MSDVILVKASNPFVPNVCLISVPARSGRERFKKVFFGILAANVVFLLGLLITEYRRELVVSAKELPAGTAPPAMPAAGALAASSAPAQASLPCPPVSSTPVPAHPETVYSVISSDTLNSIARMHGTTVKAIKAANGLSTEHLTVGQKLKIP
jgi:LysM repeat protein